MSEAPLVKCPSCGNDTLARVMGGGGGLIFKGSGFYLTDYKGDAKKTSPTIEKKEEKKPDSTTPPPTDSSDTKNKSTESKKPSDS